MILEPTVVLSNNTYYENYNNNIRIFPIFQLDFYVYGPMLT